MVVVVTNIFIFGNVMVCLMKELILLLNLIIVLLQNLSKSYLGNKIRVKFNGSCLKQDKITYAYGKIVNIYIVYEINKKYNISSYPP